MAKEKDQERLGADAAAVGGAGSIAAPQRQDGGPAFPTGFDPEGCAPDFGMSLRDHFAAKAMQGLLASGHVAQYVKRYGLSSSDEDAAKQAASFAFKMADAMLAERAK